MSEDQKFDIIIKMLEQQRADFTQRFEQQDKRFEQQDKRFEQQDKMFTDLKEDLKEFKQDVKDNFREVKQDLRLDKEKLDKVYDERKQVTVQFTQAWSFAALLIVITVSFLTAGVVVFAFT